MFLLLTVLTYSLLIVLSAVLGRVQGGWDLFGENTASAFLRKIDGFLLGLIFSVLLWPRHWAYIPLLMLSVKLAEQPGVGVKGAIVRGEGASFSDDDWYAVAGRPWLTCVIRGAIGGAVASLPAFAGFYLGFDWRILWLLPLYTLMFPLALSIGLTLPVVRLGEWLHLKNAWNWSEPLQPALVTLALIALTTCNLL